MAASVLSTMATATAVAIVVTQDGTTPFASFNYPANPPDGRGGAQWQTDCGTAALATVNQGALGDGGPDGTVALAQETVTG